MRRNTVSVTQDFIVEHVDDRFARSRHVRYDAITPPTLSALLKTESVVDRIDRLVVQTIVAVLVLELELG